MPYTKVYTKRIKDLNKRPSTINLLEENTGRTLPDIWRQYLFRSISQSNGNSNKINTWNLIKLKSFCTAKEAVNKKTANRMGENICKWCNQQRIRLQNLQTVHSTRYQKNKQPSQKWAEGLHIHFSKEGIQIVKRHMKRYSTTVIIREMQIKTTVRYHPTPIRMAIIKKIYKQ